MPSLTPTPHFNSEGWDTYARLVLNKLEDHDNLLNEINKELTLIRVEISMLKVKSGVWGLVGGLIPVTIAVIVAILRII